MKKYVLTALALATMMTFSGIPVFAQSYANEAQQTAQTIDSARYLTYGTIQSMTYEKDVLKSITAKDVKGGTIVYQIDEKTIFLDSGRKIKGDISSLKEGDAVYFYHTLEKETSIPMPITAEAVITNIPMDTACAKMHTVEAITINQNGTITVTADQGSLHLTTAPDVIIKDYNTNHTMQLSDIQIGQRFFTWYDTVLESYPAQTGMKQMVVLPIEKEPEQKSDADMVKNKVTYEKETLPVVKGISFVPLRETATKLGLFITWDPQNRITKLESDTRSMRITEGKDYYISSSTIKGAVGMTSPLQLGAAPFIDKTNTMYVPAEAFRALVGYDVMITDDTITITKSK